MKFYIVDCFAEEKYQGNELLVVIADRAVSDHEQQQIAREINERKLYERWDKAPVTDKQVYAVIMSHPETFCKSEGRIRLMI